MEVKCLYNIISAFYFHNLKILYPNRNNKFLYKLFKYNYKKNTVIIF